VRIKITFQGLRFTVIFRDYSPHDQVMRILLGTDGDLIDVTQLINCSDKGWHCSHHSQRLPFLVGTDTTVNIHQFQAMKATVICPTHNCYSKVNYF